MTKVLKKQCTYNVILMRDDGAIRSLKVKKMTLRLFFIVFLLLTLGGGFGIGAGFHYWRITQDYKENKVKLAKANQKLRQVTNYEKLAEVTAPPTPTVKNESFTTGSANGQVDELGVVNSTTEVYATPLSPTTNATLFLSNSNATMSHDSEGKQLLSIDNEVSPIRINNLVTRVTANSGMRLRYELLSLPQDQYTKGSVEYALKLTDGKIIESGVKNFEDGAFAISRMKIFDFGLTFPQDITPRSIEGIVITVNVENGGVFQSLYPVSR